MPFTRYLAKCPDHALKFVLDGPWVVYLINMIILTSSLVTQNGVRACSVGVQTVRTHTAGGVGSFQQHHSANDLIDSGRMV